MPQPLTVLSSAQDDNFIRSTITHGALETMTDSKTEFILVRTTSNDVAILQKIGRQLVLERLAACVQISGPLQSQFYWEGKIDMVEEWSCSVKTTRDAWQRVQQTIQEMHNYDTPEIVVVPIIDGSASYLNWIRENIDMGS